MMILQKWWVFKPTYTKLRLDFQGECILEPLRHLVWCLWQKSPMAHDFFNLYAFVCVCVKLKLKSYCIEKIKMIFCLKEMICKLWVQCTNSDVPNVQIVYLHDFGEKYPHEPGKWRLGKYARPMGFIQLHVLHWFSSRLSTGLESTAGTLHSHMVQWKMGCRFLQHAVSFHLRGPIFRWTMIYERLQVLSIYSGKVSP